jgi:hypothetical protein
MPRLHITVSVDVRRARQSGSPKFEQSISREATKLYFFSQLRCLRRRTPPTNAKQEPRPLPYDGYTMLEAVFKILQWICSWLHDFQRRKVTFHHFAATTKQSIQPGRLLTPRYYNCKIMNFFVFIH